MASIAAQIAERSEGLAHKQAKADFFKLCRMLLKHGNSFNARPHAEAERCSDRVKNILQKTVVTGGDLTSWASVSDYVNIQEAFQQSLRSASVFDTALNDGMVRAPLHSRGFSITTGISGSIVPEGSIKPVSSLVMAQQLLELKKASAIVVTSKELADFPGAATLFSSELTKGVVAATDANFLAALIAATTPIASAGASLVNVTTDFDALLAAVTTTATSKLFYVTSPTNMKGLLVKANAGGQPAYPGVTINGGTIFGGITAIASDQISSTAALLFDAQAVVGNADLIVPGRSEQSTLQVQTSPDSPPVAGTTLLSLWQSNLVALRMERFFAFTIMRSSGVASLSGVNY
jgi:hypothetical protein